MKKIILLSLCFSLLVGLSSCGSNAGLTAKKDKKTNDVKIKGAKSLNQFDPNKDVYASDSLYFGNEPSLDHQVFLGASKSGNFTLPNTNGNATLPAYIYQVKSGTYEPNDYLWAVKLTDNGNENGELGTEKLIGDDLTKLANNLNTDKTSTKNGKKTPKNRNVVDKTFSITGAKIKVTKKDDPESVYREPYVISFVLNEEEELDRMIVYNNNGMDYYSIDLNDTESGLVVFETPGDKTERRVTVDGGRYNQFTFVSKSGRFADIGLGKNIELINVKVVKREGMQEEGSYYILAFDNNSNKEDKYPQKGVDKDSNKKTVQGDSYNKMDTDCSGYLNIKLPGLSRPANYNNYPGGYYSLSCCDVYKFDPALFQILTRVNANGTAAIGFDRATNRNQSTVVIGLTEFQKYCTSIQLKTKYGSSLQAP